MYRVLPLMLMIGLIALAPLALPAQDKKVDEKKVIDEPKKVDEKKVDEKKPDEKKPDEKKPDEKKPDEVKPDEVKPADTAAKSAGIPVTVMKELDYSEKATQIMPFVSLILIVILFVLVLSLRSSVSQLEEKVRGGS